MSIRPSIAVIEDDDSVREATIGLLRSHGFIAKGFPSADAFLKSNRIRITSCLIADVQMPDMSGLALYGHLVAVGAPIQTILITAYPDEAVRARYERRGDRLSRQAFQRKGAAGLYRYRR
jgi:FixJ family two-component response regulator